MCLIRVAAAFIGLFALLVMIAFMFVLVVTGDVRVVISTFVKIV